MLSLRSATEDLKDLLKAHTSKLKYFRQRPKMQTRCMKLLAGSENRGIILAADDVRLENNVWPVPLYDRLVL
jgi:hypothetical protein